MATKKTRTKKSPNTTPEAPKATRKVTQSSTKRTRTKKTVAPLAVRAPRTVTHEEIARRAYQLWEQRGCAHGHDAQDWATAENQLMV